MTSVPHHHNDLETGSPESDHDENDGDRYQQGMLCIATENGQDRRQNLREHPARVWVVDRKHVSCERIGSSPRAWSW
jgi:hypothetical protein